MEIETARALENGVYRVWWDGGGVSVAAVGRSHNGWPWMAAANWTAADPGRVSSGDQWGNVARVELLAHVRGEAAQEAYPLYPASMDLPAAPTKIDGFQFHGLTKREHAAIAILPAVVQATSAGQHSVDLSDGCGITAALARDAVKLADALLQELAK
jgi:hypothetical protein